MNNTTNQQTHARLLHLRTVYSSTANCLNISQASGSISVSASNEKPFAKDDFFRTLERVSRPSSSQLGIEN